MNKIITKQNETQKHINQEKRSEKMKRAERKFLTTRYILEDEGLKELVQKARTDTKRKPIKKQIAELFYYIQVKDGVKTIDEAKVLEDKAAHICEEDLEKIYDYILSYKGLG